MNISEAAKIAAKQIAKMHGGYIHESLFDCVTSAELIQSALRAHEAETIERCAQIAYCDEPPTIYYRDIDVLETKECIAVRKQIAASIRAQKGTK